MNVDRLFGRATRRVVVLFLPKPASSTRTRWLMFSFGFIPLIAFTLDASSIKHEILTGKPTFCIFQSCEIAD